MGDGQEHGDDQAWDGAEAKTLYTLLEQEVIPAFYIRDANGYVYSAQVPASQPAADYMPRLIPNRPEAAVPLEAAQILW